MQILFEAETFSMLAFGFYTVLGLAALVVLYGWSRRRRSGYLWVLAHLVTCAAAVAIALSLESAGAAATRADQGAMLSENSSLRIGLAGVVWAASMGFLLVGVGRLGRK